VARAHAALRAGGVTARPLAPDLAGTYDRVVRAYAARFLDELDGKPFDRALLDGLADALRGRGPVCDLGCGPGHVARYLAARGVEVFGVDLSPGMVALARELTPALRFEQGDMRALALADGALVGIVAFYSVIHLPRAALPQALAEMTRVLAPGAPLQLAFHGGQGEVHTDDFLGQGVAVDATLFTPDEMAAALRGAGLAVEEIVTRPPYDFEYPSQRVYARAVRPGRQGRM
jgi:SAM-dependent methyltransferase